MGRIVKLDNWTKNEVVSTGIARANVLLKNTNGASFNVYANTTYNNWRSPFYVDSVSDTTTEPKSTRPYPYACSDTTINKSRYDLSNTFGTATIGFTRTDTGWNANIQIVHNAEATINSLLFAVKCWTDSNTSHQETALFFAYILDSPITLNAENNYTANLTMSVSFE